MKNKQKKPKKVRVKAALKKKAVKQKKAPPKPRTKSSKPEDSENIFRGKNEEEIMQELRRRIISSEYKETRKKEVTEQKSGAVKKLSVGLFGFGKKKKKTTSSTDVKTWLGKPKSRKAMKSASPKRAFSLKKPSPLGKPLAPIKKPPLSTRAVSLKQGETGLKGIATKHDKETITKTTPVAPAKPIETELRKSILASTKQGLLGQQARKLQPEPVPPEVALALSPIEKKPSNKVIYLTVGFLLTMVIAGGLLIAYLLLFSPPQVPQQNDLNKVTEQPMPADMAQALAGNRSSSVKPLSPSVTGEVPRGLVNQKEDTGTEKFETHGSMLEVSFDVSSNEKATIERVSFLKEGRISVTPAGDYSVQLLDNQGRILYKLPFNAVFVIMSDPPTEINRIRFVFVLPAKENAVKVAVAKGNRVLAEKEIK